MYVNIGTSQENVKGLFPFFYSVVRCARTKTYKIEKGMYKK